MTRKILVPTDFSQQAGNAFEVACQIATRYNAELHLLHLVELPYSLIDMIDNNRQTTLPEALYFLKLAQRNFNNLKTETKKLLQEIPLVESVKFNTVHHGIIEYTEENAIDAIIMGSHGSSGFEELFIGSNTEKIVRNAPVPVLVIKKHHEDFKINTLVFATDLEEDNKQPILKSIAFAKSYEATIKFVFINTPERFKTSLEIHDLLEKFTNDLGTQLSHFEIYNDLKVERGILNYAKDQKADLIGIGTHGRKGLAHFFNGSLSEDLVNHAKRPVLTFRI